MLSAQLSPDRMTPLIKDLNLPQGWHAGVLDGQYRIVTRTRDPERWVGSKTNPGLIAALDKTSHGVLDLVTREGLDVLIVYQRSCGARLGRQYRCAARGGQCLGLCASMSNLFLSVA
ncbi:hypothetical protein LP419_01345 [Massilia sp. H-1]|nr:hypothetical protein LP419_01345 [Massilia sp. H-1]